MSYVAEISRSNPTAFLFLIDQSGSMCEPVGDTEYTKAEFLCDSLNRVVMNLIARSSKSEGVRDYFHVGAIGYGGQGVGNALSGPFAGQIFHPISAFERSPIAVESRQRKVGDGAGGFVTQTVKFPVWFKPHSDGGTPMRKAIRSAAEALVDWCDQHPNSFPPTVLHITDGEPTDGDPEPMADHLRQLGTDDGELLFFNLHVDGRSGLSLKFPAQEDSIKDPYAKVLFRMSSELPPSIAMAAQERGYPVSAGSRGFFFNVEPVEMVEFFDIGTRASSQSMLLR